jgi:hypothetical protein
MNTEIEQLVKDKEKSDNEFKQKLLQLQEKCSHKNINADAAVMWHDWPDYGTDYGLMICADCMKIVGKNFEETSFKIRNGERQKP